MKFRRAVYGTASLMLAFIMLNSTNLTAQAQLLPLPPPVPTFLANDDSATTDEDNPTTVNVLANDQGSETGLFFVRSVTQPLKGAAEITSSNTIRYTPNPNSFGSDSFRYTASDATGRTQSTASVFVTINPVNDPPVANDDTAVTDENTSTSVNVLSNDSDVDDDKLTVISVTQPSNGMGEIFSNGFVIYTPNRNFDGNDSFTYTISDGNGGTATATVYVTVNPVSNFAINKVSSGLAASDPLTIPKTKEQLQADSTDLWTFGGSATAQNAPVDFFQDADGLHIGTQAVSPGAYAGYYAVTINNASLSHAVITTPVRTISSNFFQNALYVQTVKDGLLNYVTCVSVTGQTGTAWHVAHALGNTTYTTKLTVLWSDTSVNQPLTRDCTIITNGNNYLKVYLDNVLVYENRTLDLQMPPPFMHFLEPQNSHTTMQYGIYKDFYTASDEKIKVINTPSAATRVEIVDGSGNILASAPVISGIAVLDVGKYHFPLAAQIKVYDSTNAEIASTTAPGSLVGGDVYSVDRTS